MNTSTKSTTRRISALTGQSQDALTYLHDLSPESFAEVGEDLPFTQAWQRDAVRVWPYLILTAALIWLFVCFLLGAMGTPMDAAGLGPGQ